MVNEKGYVLIITIAIICMLTVTIAVLANRTIFAAALALRREERVQALAMAENGLREAFWQLSRNAEFRTAESGETKYLDQWSYNYQIIDATPADTTDDLTLEVTSIGSAGNQQCTLTLELARDAVDSDFAISAWREEKD
jgi:Tfp pilus assembly protein PilX